MPDITNVNPYDEDAVLKEVWGLANVKAKTELSPEQIESVSKLMVMADIFDSRLLADHLTNFMALQKSKNRQSMKEFVDVVRARREDFVQKGQGFFKSMLG